MAQTFGQYLLNDELPTGTRVQGQLTKKKLYNTLLDVARSDPDAYGKVVQGVKRVGDMAATFEGISTGLDDLKPLYGQRNALMRSTLTSVKSAKTDKAKQKVIASAQKKFQDMTLSMNTDLGIMVRSGGRGSANQLMKAVTSPVAAGDRKGGLEPWLITRSYAEGLRPDELWVTNGESRRNAISAKEAVSEPGAFGKILVSNMTGQTVTEHDCGTKGGIRTEIGDADLVGRYLARTVRGFSRNDQITEEMRSTLAKNKVSHVTARSTLTCQSLQGVCRLCYGLDEWQKLPKIGTNLGIRSAQALTEPLTQFAMNAKHGVRLAGDAAEPGTAGLKGLQNFLEFPKSFLRKATVSEVTGRIKKVKAAPQGGHDVDVEHDGGVERHYVVPGLDVVVGVGDKITSGDVLSKGVAMPNEVVRHKGLSAGRLHIADTVNKLYAAQGRSLDKRHAELLARAHLGYVRVMGDASGEHTVGAIVPYDKVHSKFSEKTEKIPVKESAGRTLGQYVLHYGPGTEITPQIIAALKRDEIKEVEVSSSSFKVRPVVKPITRNPLLDPNWMGRMSHRYLKDTMRDAAAEGAVAPLHSTHPIPAFIHGAAFGEGEGGTY